MSNLLPPIKYLALLGERDLPLFINVPPASIVTPMLRILGKLPQSLFQFVYGLDYYENVKHFGLQLGYDIDFIYPDTPDFSSEVFLQINGPVVLLLCTDDEKVIARYNDLFAGIHMDSFLCVLYKEVAHLWTPQCTIAFSEREIFNWLYTYAKSHTIIETTKLPFSVHIFEKSLYDMENVFSPSRVNTQIFNSMIANWGYSQELTDEDVVHLQYESSKDALSQREKFDRQDILIKQIKKMRSLEMATIQTLPKLEFFLDQYRSALIIALPYTSIDMRRVDDKTKLEESEKKEVALVEEMLDYYYSPSYVISKTKREKWTAEEFNNIIRIQSTIVRTRMDFFDFVGLLHSSIKFSPYLRLPILGRNINAELSFVGIKNLNKISVASSKCNSIKKIMEKIGRKIAQSALSSSALEMLEKSCNQLVVMTDLPIEWTMVNGVPLGFSHDVCRIPETPVTNMLAQYVECKMNPYIIPKDILKKTLVVFGNQDPAFVEAQEMVIDLQRNLDFSIAVCLSKEAFFEAMSQYKPELLIMDCHGGTDEKTHQSILYLGEEILTGNDIVGSEIDPKLVFLSACNTFPTYNTVSTIANAFFEKGSLAVTTSYMPLEVLNSSILYVRLLRNLSEAAVTYVHFNWCAFMSHLLRTSYIYAPMTNIKKKTEDLSKANLLRLAQLSTESMDFNKRRNVYSNLYNKEFTTDMGVSYQNVIPHYLMYSTLGRADMIRFQIAVEKVGYGVVERLVDCNQNKKTE